MVGGLDPGLEQAVHLRQPADLLPGPDLDEELVPHGPEEPLDLPPALGLTGQSKIILWITVTSQRF